LIATGGNPNSAAVRARNSDSARGSGEARHSAKIGEHENPADATVERLSNRLKVQAHCELELA
jgi:hypothetical protein